VCFGQENCYKGVFSNGEQVHLTWVVRPPAISFNATFPKGKDTWASFGIGSSTTDAMMNTNLFVSYESGSNYHLNPYSFGDSERGGHPNLMQSHLQSTFYHSHPSGAVNFGFQRLLRSTEIRNLFNIFNEEHRILFAIGEHKPNSTTEIGGHSMVYEFTARKINLLGRFNNC